MNASTAQHAQEGRPVVVAVAEDGYEAALAFAVDAARRTASDIEVVHVLRLPGEVYVDFSTGYDAAARRLLTEASARAEELGGGDVRVTSRLVDDGWLVGSIVDASATGSLAVLQHRRFGPLHRLVTRSIVNGVAARADVPVAAVPEGWTPRAGETSVVTVAVQDADEAPRLLRSAAVEASARGARLEVLHTWWMANGYDDLVVDAAIRRRWDERSRAALEPAVSALAAEWPDLDVSVRVEHAAPAEALVEASRGSALLVVGRRHHRLPLFSHLGPVVRAVIDRSECPVLVAPETVDHPVGADVAPAGAAV